MRLHLVAPYLCLVIAAPAMADLSCTVPPQTSTVTLHLEQQPPRIDNTKTRNALNGFKASIQSPYAGQQNVHVNGLMQGTIGMRTKMNIAWQRTKNGAINCLWYDNIDVLLSFQPVIYVASEIKPGSCLYSEVLNHEQKHLDTDLAILALYQERIKDKMNRLLQQTTSHGPYSADIVETVRQNMSNNVNAVIEAIHKELQQERIRRQSEIDTLAEYQRVAKLCPDDVKGQL